MKSQLAEVQTGFEPLLFHIQADFQWQRPFSEGCGVDFRKIEEKSFTKLWALDCWFSRTKSSAFFALKKGAEIGGVLYVRRKHIAEGKISARGGTEAPAQGAGRKAVGRRPDLRQME